MINVCLRTIFFYFFITIAFRIMGKREMGELGIIDFIVSMLISQMVAISIENYSDSIFYTVFPVLTLVFLEIFLGYLSLKSRTFNKLFGGKLSVIISEGKLVYKNMVNQRYGIDDLLLELRKAGISSIEEVEYAFLEPNGSLSIFKYKPFKIKGSFPMPVIVEGNVQKRTLSYLNKTEKWLYDVLEQNSLDISNVFYAIYDKRKMYVIRKNHN